MNLNLQEKVAIVTGATQGIGRAIAATLAEEGCHVVLVGRNDQNGLKVKDAILALGEKALWCQGDVADPTQCEQVVAKAVEEFGQVDILVNNAGSFAFKSFLKMSQEDCEREINTNYYGVMNFTRAVLDIFVKQHAGTVLCVSSAAGKVGEAKQPVYSGTKAAVNVFIKALAKDYGRYNIRFNTICPAFTTSEGAMALFNNPEEVVNSEHFLAPYALRKLGTPQDCADLIAFLASDRAGNITGQNISVDGGLVMG